MVSFRMRCSLLQEFFTDFVFEFVGHSTSKKVH